ncbi:hypothetical protein QTN94_14360 [Vibrio sp. M250220]|uniref:hypothetical protein n=1 Tax=Vibrio sp. M250220 TaxID=3020894 RepID=UPI002F4069C9
MSTTSVSGLTQEFIDSNFRKYHLNTISKWVKGDRDGLTEELAKYSIDIMVSCEGFSISEIAESTLLSLKDIRKTFYPDVTDQEWKQIKSNK